MTKTTRYSGLDFTRGILMILGVFYHAALIYTPGSTWAARSSENHLFFAYFTQFSSSFRMQAFYIIAGFFFLLVIDKKGTSAALKERLVRLFVPMLFIGFTLNFFPNLASDYYTFPDSAFDYISNGEWLRHTWFLGNLIIYCLVGSLIYRKSLIRFIAIRARFFKACMFLGILCIPVFVFVMKDQAWRITGYDNYFFIAPRYLLVFLPYFILGALAYLWKEFLFDFLNIKIFLCLIALSVGAALIRYFYLQNVVVVDLIFLEVSVLFLCIAMICLLNEIGQRVNPAFSQKVADASYTIYLLHTPLIIVLYYYIFKGVKINIFTQYAMICFLVLTFSYYFHTKVVFKNKTLSFLLNGKSIKR